MSRKKGLAILLIIAVLATGLAIIYSVKATDGKPLLYWGRRGGDVYLLQRKLKQWGYYEGSIDGVFGNETRSAVLEFQRKNGLRVDGLVGPETWAALGYRGRTVTGRTVSARGTTNRDDVYLLARLVHAEARGEPYRGQVAVAAVVLNRVRSPRFPNSISGVVYQPMAFESVANGQINLPPTQQNLQAARSAMNGWDPTYGCTFFWNPSKPVSQWIWSRPIITRIGSHVFAK